MDRLKRAPSGALRGDLVTETPLLPPATLVAPHLLYWSTRIDELDELEYSPRARTPRAIIDSLEIFRGLYQATQEAGAFPEFMRPALPRLQILGGSAIAFSMMLREQESASSYLEHAQITTQATAIEIATDLGVPFRWYVKPGLEGRLIDGYEPSSSADEWYAADRYYAHIQRGPSNTSEMPAPSDEFNELHQAFYGRPFDAAAYVAITPVINRTLLQAV